MCGMPSPASLRERLALVANGRRHSFEEKPMSNMTYREFKAAFDQLNRQPSLGGARANAGVAYSFREEHMRRGGIGENFVRTLVEAANSPARTRKADGRRPCSAVSSRSLPTNDRSCLVGICEQQRCRLMKAREQQKHLFTGRWRSVPIATPKEHELQIALVTMLKWC